MPVKWDWHGMLKKIIANLTALKIQYKEFTLLVEMKQFTFVNVSKGTYKVKLASAKRSLTLCVLLNLFKFHQFHAPALVSGIKSTINVIATHLLYFSLTEHAKHATNIRHGTVIVVFVNQVITLSMANV